MWIQLNDKGYVCYTGENQQPNSFEYFGELPKNFKQFFNWYKFIDGQLVFDAEGKAADDNQTAVLDRIFDLKEYLNGTDYNCEKILEGLFNVLASSNALNLVPNLLAYIASIKDNYTQIFAARQAARDEINELEN